MKAPAFNHNTKQWDRFEAFHNTLHGTWPSRLFVLFESGEWMITRSRLKPLERRTYEDFGVALTYTQDNHFQFATPDGEHVPTAWLTQGGSQTLMVDLDKRRAYKVSAVHAGKIDQLPRHAKTARLYVPGPWATPVTRAGIELARPDKEFTKGHKQWMDDVRAVCTARVRMAEGSVPSYVPGYRYKLTDRELAMSVDEFCAHATPYQDRYIAANGFMPRRAIVEVPYLLVKEA